MNYLAAQIFTGTTKSIWIIEKSLFIKKCDTCYIVFLLIEHQVREIHTDAEDLPGEQYIGLCARPHGCPEALSLSSAGCKKDLDSFSCGQSAVSSLHPLQAQSINVWAAVSSHPIQNHGVDGSCLLCQQEGKP